MSRSGKPRSLGTTMTPARRVALIAGVALLLTGCFKPMALHMQQTDPNSRPWWCHSELMMDEPAAAWYMDRGIEKGDW